MKRSDSSRILSDNYGSKRTRRINFRVPEMLFVAIDKLCRERGYKSMSRFFVGLSLLAIQDSRRPKWVLHIANADPKLQDLLIEKMLAFPIDDVHEMARQMKKIDSR